MTLESDHLAALPNCFIIGSCVTRDSFGPGSSAPGVAEYYARSPIGSMFAERPNADYPNFDAIESKFQRRMVEADWMKNVPRALKDTKYDCVLVDLIDERFDLAEVGGSIFSVSNEMKLTGYDLGEAVITKFGTPRHQEHFERGFTKLVELVGPDRIIVSRVFWAKQVTNGALTGAPGYIDAANSALQRLYSYLESFPLRWIEYPDDLLVADADHKWGVSPFHYVKDFYARTREELGKLTSDAETSG